MMSPSACSNFGAIVLTMSSNVHFPKSRHLPHATHPRIGKCPTWISSVAMCSSSKVRIISCRARLVHPCACGLPLSSNTRSEERSVISVSKRFTYIVYHSGVFIIAQVNFLWIHTESSSVVRTVNILGSQVEV